MVGKGFSKKHSTELMTWNGDGAEFSFPKVASDPCPNLAQNESDAQDGTIRCQSIDHEGRADTSSIAHACS